jgi:hypothetical protein
MSESVATSATRSRWLDWKPKAPILAKPARNAPSKPTQLRFAGFDGADRGQSSEMAAARPPIDWWSRYVQAKAERDARWAASDQRFRVGWKL